jgi:hypothetical protein
MDRQARPKAGISAQDGVTYEITRKRRMLPTKQYDGRGFDCKDANEA